MPLPYDWNVSVRTVDRHMGHVRSRSSHSLTHLSQKTWSHESLMGPLGVSWQIGHCAPAPITLCEQMKGCLASFCNWTGCRTGHMTPEPKINPTPWGSLSGDCIFQPCRRVVLDIHKPSTSWASHSRWLCCDCDCDCDCSCALSVQTLCRGLPVTRYEYVTLYDTQ